MATISLPAVGYQPAYPQLVESVSVSRAGNRAIAFVDYADMYWSITMRTVPLGAGARLLVEAFRDACRGGLQTVLYTPKHMCLPRAYWGNPGSPHLADGSLVSIAGNQLTLGATNGLTLGPGDLISATTDEYNSLFRVQAGGVAASGSLIVTVEPTVPSYITAGGGTVVRFKNPVANMRVMPGSFSIADDFFPVASWQMVEVPK